MKLATILLAAALLSPSLAFAQGATPPADIKTFLAGAGIQALIAKAKAMPSRPLISQPIVGTGGARANLEYRAGPANPASIHDTENELFYVIEGSGTMTSGGTLVNGKRTNPANQSGDSITGGTNTHLAKGDFMIVPAGTAHQITADNGVAIVLMTFHAAATP
jgi:mannose-6-phosphate isomerase-like protein (cupin superfamily)